MQTDSCQRRLTSNSAHSGKEGNKLAVEMNNIQLADLLDLDAVQKMADAHYKAAGMPIGIIDAFDSSILVGVGWQDICVNFHRANPESLKRCQASDANIKKQLTKGETCQYKCQNGLWDIGIPIMVSEQHLATLFLGQFFYDDEIQEKEFFIQQAQTFQYDLDEYLAALDRVPVFSHEKVQNVLEYNKALVNFLANMAAQTLSIRTAQIALRESEEKFRLIFRASPDALGINRLPDGLYVDVNPGFCHITGLDREDVIGRTYQEILLFDDPGNWRKLIGVVQEKGLCENLEAKIRRKDGSFATGLISASMIPLQGEPHIITITRDISARTQAEEKNRMLQERLLQVQKLEAIGRLAGGVAHDFNNMLGVILGYAELAIEQIDPMQPVYSAMQEIRKATERSVALTRQLLGFARKQTITPKVLDLNETVESMLKMLHRIIGEEIDLIWIPGHDLWSSKLDPGQVDQILANLLVNARHAINGVGKVTLTTGNKSLDETFCQDHPGVSGGDFVMLSVCDNGCGIAEETLDQIFEPFFTSKATGEGTGLGLATVYGIVRQNDGFINVFTEVGKGTTFHIYFPRYKGKPDPVGKENQQTFLATCQQTILLVEDEPAILNMTRIMLEKMDYRVLAAGTPGEALQMAETHTGVIHLLLTDVVMPEMNGRELLEKLTSLYPSMGCLFVSGYSADVIAHRGVLDKEMNFIQKPFTKNELEAKVRQVLDGTNR